MTEASVTNHTVTAVSLWVSICQSRTMVCLRTASVVMTLLLVPCDMEAQSMNATLSITLVPCCPLVFKRLVIVVFATQSYTACTFGDAGM